MKNVKLLAWVTLFALVIAFSAAAFAGKTDNYFNFQVGDTKLWIVGGQECMFNGTLPENMLEKEKIIRKEKKGSATYVYTNNQKEARYMITGNRVSFYDKQMNVTQVIGLTEMGVGTTWDDTITIDGKNYALKWRCDEYKTIKIPPIDQCCDGREGNKCRRSLKSKAKSYKALYCKIVSPNTNVEMSDDNIYLMSTFDDMYYVKGTGLARYGEGEVEAFLWKYKLAKRK